MRPLLPNDDYDAYANGFEAGAEAFARKSMPMPEISDECIKAVVNDMLDNHFQTAVTSANDVQGDNLDEAVDHPGHYTFGSIECIDAIQSSMKAAQFRGYLKGNIIKYLWRFEEKGGLEDLKKARWYLDRLISHYES